MHNVITSIHAHVITIENLSFEMAGTLNVLLLLQVRYNTDLVIELNLTTILSAEIFLYIIIALILKPKTRSWETLSTAECSVINIAAIFHACMHACMVFANWYIGSSVCMHAAGMSMMQGRHNMQPDEFM